MTRPDNLGALPFSDYADADPNRLPLDHEDDGPRWSAETAAAGHEFRATALVPGWCVRCGCARFVHGGAT